MMEKKYYFYVANIESGEIVYVGSDKTIKNGLTKMLQSVCDEKGETFLYNFDNGVGYDFDGEFDNCYVSDSSNMYTIVKKFFLGGHHHCIFESYELRFHIKKIIKNENK